MNVNFTYINEIEFFIFALNQVVIIENCLVDETNYASFISGTIDA